MAQATQASEDKQGFSQFLEDISKETGTSFSDMRPMVQSIFDGAFAVDGLAKQFHLAGQSLENASCLIIFTIVENKPAKLIYCAQSLTVAVKNAKRLVASLRRLNPSIENAKQSPQVAQRKTYREALKGVGPLKRIELGESEKAFQTSRTAECARFPNISQERYECYETEAKVRIDAIAGTLKSGSSE